MMKQSLRKNKEFQYIYRTGKSSAAKPMVLLHVRSKLPMVRVGFSVSKKVGNAVVRNRAKRRMREAFLRLLPEIRAHHNLIFVARVSISTATFAQILSSMRYLLNKENLLVSSQSASESLQAR